MKVPWFTAYVRRGPGEVLPLNSIPNDKIRSIDVKSFDAISRHTRTQASREGSPRDFGMDVEQDLLRAVTGTPADATLGSRLTGMDALNVVVPTTIRDIPNLLDRFYDKYLDQAYKVAYPWIDQIAEVRDPARVSFLDELVVERLRQIDLDRLWFAVPDILNWTDVDGFRYSNEPDDEDLHPDLHARDFLATIADPAELTVDVLRSRRVKCIATSTGRTTETWTAYQCIYCEIDEGGETLLLSGGKWYRITKDYVSGINRAVKRLAVVGEPLPPYTTSDKTEREYNKRVADGDPARYAFMDGNLIAFGGNRSSFEFCDLFTKAGGMIHVKRYGGSSVLSHLFSQGEEAGTLFFTEPGFRKLVIKKLPSSHRGIVPEDRPPPDKFEVIFAVVSRSQKPIADALPFFSRLNLRNRARILRGFGCKVSLTKISMA